MIKMHIDEIIKNYSTYIKKCIRSRVGKNQVDDIYQEVMVVLIQESKNYNSQRSTIKTFLSNMVRNIISTYFRGKEYNFMYRARNDNKFYQLYKELRALNKENLHHKELKAIADNLSIPIQNVIDTYNSLYSIEFREDLADIVDETENNPEDIVSRQECVELIQSTINKLPSLHKTIVVSQLINNNNIFKLKFPREYEEVVNFLKKELKSLDNPV